MNEDAGIQWIGRLQWYVGSDSRLGMVHLVDFEPTEYERFIPMTRTSDDEVCEDGKPPGWISTTVVEPTFCSCEAFNMLHHRPCRHQQKVIRMLVNSIPLTGEEREQMTYELEELCRQSPHWRPQDLAPEPPEPKPTPSIQSKRHYTIHTNHPQRTHDTTPPNPHQ